MNQFVVRVERFSYRYGTAMLGWVLGIAAVVCLLVFGIIRPAMTWQRGIYAGFHYGDAKYYVQQVLATDRGLALSKRFRLAIPDVVNTHSDKTRNLYQEGRQVREFHLYGPRGVKWCVSVWDGGQDPTRDYKIVKGCKF